jgi:radical SAM superfamily enzyme YgiQ (UPF0313 family)
MTDIILFFPRTGLDKIIQLPLSALCIASTLPDYDVLLLDERVNNDSLKIIENKSPNAICFGVSTMTGKQIHYALRASQIAYSKTKVVWGGIHPSLEPRQTLANKNVDIVVRGEGELSFPDVVNSISMNLELGKILGIGFREANGREVLTPNRPFADMSCLPELPYHKLDIDRYIVQRDGFKRCLTLQTSRGCPHSCTFCINPIYNRQKWRCIKAEQMVERTESLKERYKLDGIIYQEDNFFASMSRVVDFCNLMIRRNVGIGWKANCRISYLVDKGIDFFSLLEESGCKLLQFGVESGSDRILNLLNKQTTVSQITSVNKKLGKSKLKCRYNFIVGLPGETDEEIKATFEFIEKLKRENKNLESCFVNLYTPWPSTQLFSQSVQMGFNPPKTLEEWESFSWNSITTPWINKKTATLLKKLSKEFLKKSNYFGNNLGNSSDC